ncbi:type 1 fimbria pilin [Serratia fonticola]|uniref:Type 1 fimbria pilin n=1 Tax=Serratia fonticola TaxID=47917 RepID=A0A542BHB3_SERFO|nr:type 1 fimbria pilin [Serratia fonticola]TQI95027.1 type 1 fimbria pilin [Serratia fonticola]TVZ69525.1 type 1 fimbria pilin [Serratia fonticola]
MSLTMMKTALLLAASLAANVAHSACEFLGELTIGIATITIPDQTIGAGTVSGSELYTYNFPPSLAASNTGVAASDFLLKCTAGESLIWGDSEYEMISGGNGYGYLKTGIDNLYIRAYTAGGSTSSLRFPTASGGEFSRTVSTLNNGNPRWADIGNMRFVLERVGPVTQGGIIPAKILSSWRTSDGSPLLFIRNSAFTVNVQGCSVSTKNVSVPMGTVHRSKFRGVGSTAGHGEGNIALQCDAAVAPTVTFSGAHDPETSAEVLALNNLGDANVASGVGIQMLYKNTPITLDSPIALGKLSGPMAVNIPFSARYYQTASTIKGGDANATAYFTINYE